MLDREYLRDKPHGEKFDEPRTGHSVWPCQRCPAFTPRQNASPKQVECWYCRYADFHLTEPVALEVGICCWPEVRLE